MTRSKTFDSKAMFSWFNEEEVKQLLSFCKSNLANAHIFQRSRKNTSSIATMKSEKKNSLILQHGSSLPVSKHTHIFRNNSTGDSRNAQKQTTCSKLGPLASLGFLQKMLKLAKTFHTPPPRLVVHTRFAIVG